LNSLSKQHIQLDEEKEADVITKTIADRLNENGYDVDLDIGQSYFKCNIGVRTKGDIDNYKLGILIDDQHHYQNVNILEQYYLRPSILKAFGWKVIQIYSKDWYKDEQRVIDRLLRLLGENIKEEVEDEVDIQELVEDLETIKPIQEEPKKVVNIEPEVIVETVDEELEISDEPTVIEEEIEPSIPKEPKTKKTVPKTKVPKKPIEEGIKPLSKTKEENYVPNTAYAYENSQYFEFADERSFKFWEIAQNELSLGIRYGRIGTKGQVQLKSFETEEETKRELEKLIRSKISKGYLKID
jgi:predicted DNA-binding WGR domain protein